MNATAAERALLPLAAALPRAARAAVTATWLALALALATLAAHEAGALGGRSLNDFFYVWDYDGILALAAALTAVRALVVRSERWAWASLATALSLWAAGEIYWSVVLRGEQNPPFPSLADGCWIVFYLFAYAALVLLVRSHVRRFHTSVWLDGAIGGLAVAALGSALVLEPVIRTTHGTLAVVATNLAYPLGDFLLMAFVIGVFALTGWRPGRTWLLIGLGLVMLAVADNVYLFRVASNTYQEGTLFDWPWPGAMALLAYAAWQTPRKRTSVRFEGIAVMLMPCLFATIALLVLVRANYVHASVITEVLAAGALVLVLARVLLTLREVQHLADSRREARTDDLTHLANRRGFYAQLNQAVDGAGAREVRFALLLIDLDRFKELNDTFGHYAGDLLLKQIGPRLERVLRGGASVARLGGDEFALMLRDVNASEDVARRIDAALRKPFQLDEVTVAIRASIGIAIFPDDARDGDGLMQRADVAMYQAKEARTVYEFYRPERDIHTPARMALTAELPGAIERGELVLEYQPKVDLASGDTCGVEALVRWQHPVRGLIPPDDFVPIAEHTGVMRELTLAVLKRALAQHSIWLAEGRELKLAVNVSVTNLLDSAFVADLSRALESAGTPPELLQIEITESVLMSDGCQVVDVLNAITALGVGVSLDDFGTGYSALAYLRQLSVNEIKIDRSFVATMIENATASAIVASTISLAADLGISVVAEGVERSDELELLRSFGCSLVQGYYFSRPLPPAELVRWMDGTFVAQASAGAALEAG